jgi:hypothetical protein
MKHFHMFIAAAALFAVASCTQFTAAEKTVCDDIAKLPVSVTSTLEAADPHSALGVLWADAKAGCANGAPTIGISQTWTAVVWGMLKAVAPTVIPWLIGLL